MIRNRDDADVGRSVRAYRHHAEVARRELAKARARLAHLDPLKAAVGATRTLALPMLKRAERRAEECRRELKYWEGAIENILDLHDEHRVRLLGWKAPVAHDPEHDERKGIYA